MMKRKVSKLAASLLALPVLLFAGNFLHVTFNHSMTTMQSGPCQSSCTSSQTPADVATKLEDVLKEKDKEPQPPEPYYLAFTGVGWTTIILIAVVYLFGYITWRPPDLYELNVNYQF